MNEEERIAEYESQPPEPKQCYCQEHPGQERCENHAPNGYGGLCIPCVIGCAP